MAVSKITQDQVGKIYEALKSEKINPSLDRIRERLGSGSKGTVQAHLKAYLQSSAESEALANVELPSEIISALQRALNDTADKATASQSEQYKNIAQLLDESDTLRCESDEQLSTTKAGLAEQIQLVSEMKAEHGKEIAALDQKIIDLDTSLKIADEKLDNSIRAQEVSRTELAKSQYQIERADDAAKLARSESEKLEIELVGLKVNNSESEKDASTFKAVSEEQKKAILILEKRLDNADKLSEKLDEKQDKLQSKIDNITADKAAISEKLAVDTTTIQNLEKQVEALLDEKRKDEKDEVD